MTNQPRDLHALLRQIDQGKSGAPVPADAVHDLLDGALPADERKTVAARVVDDRASRDQLLRAVAADQAVRAADPGPTGNVIQARGRFGWRLGSIVAAAAAVLVAVVLKWPSAPSVDLSEWSVVIAGSRDVVKGGSSDSGVRPPMRVARSERIVLTRRGAAEAPPAVAWTAASLMSPSTLMTLETTDGVTADVLAQGDPAFWLVAAGDAASARAFLVGVSASMVAAARSGADLSALHAALERTVLERPVPPGVIVFVLEVLP